MAFAGNYPVLFFSYPNRTLIYFLVQQPKDINVYKPEQCHLFLNCWTILLFFAVFRIQKFRNRLRNGTPFF